MYFSNKFAIALLISGQDKPHRNLRRCFEGSTVLDPSPISSPDSIAFQRWTRPTRSSVVNPFLLQSCTPSSSVLLISTVISRKRLHFCLDQRFAIFVKAGNVTRPLSFVQLRDNSASSWIGLCTVPPNEPECKSLFGPTKSICTVRKPRKRVADRRHSLGKHG